MNDLIPEVDINNINNYWVFSCGMFRSGSTLQYQLISELVEKSALGVRSKYLTESEFPRLLNEYKNTEGFTILKVHYITPPMQMLLDNRKAISIGCFRDIRDVAVSMMKMWNLGFNDLIEQKRLEHAIEYLDQWSQCPGHMVSKYEEMIINPINEILRIAAHLNIHCEEKAAKEIAEEYSLKKQMARVEIVARRKSELGIEEAYWDPLTLLHSNHINSGSVEGWKNFLLKEQVELLEKKFGAWLEGRGYTLS